MAQAATPAIVGITEFAAFCEQLRLENGSRMELEPFQRTMLEDYFDGVREELILIPKKNGKALALDTPIATPEGWSTMGDLKLGDEVFDETGSPCRVTYATEVMHGRRCYQVCFSDRTSVVADAEHLWETSSLHRGVGVRTTEEIASTLLRSDGARIHSISMAGAFADRPVFRMPRKRARRTRQIVAVQPVESVPVRCIQVDSPSRLYLAGEGMVPTHNTSLLAALGLFHVIETFDANCCIAASSRDQAMVLFEQMRGFVQRTPELEDEVRVLRGYREIRRVDPDDPDNPKVFRGLIKVYAADADTADGVLPTLALVDELHRHKSSELYAVFRDGLGPRGGQMITISTAGDDENSPLGELRADAYTRPGLKRDGPYRYLRDGDFALHEWALDPEDDPDDLDLVKEANPASWQTLEELRRRHDSPSTKSWEWQRFACGLWIAGEEAAISAKEWNACAQVDLEIPADATDVYIGVDLAFKHDCTAFVPVHKHGEVVVVGKPAILTPPGDGTSLPYATVWDVATAFYDRWPQSTFVLDPRANGEELAQQMSGEFTKARIATHTQLNATMALAAQRLSVGIATRKLRHPDDRQLNAHVLAASAYSVGEAWKFVKRKKKAQPIDGLIALAMAYSTLIANEQQADSGGFFL